MDKIEGPARIPVDDLFRAYVKTFYHYRFEFYSRSSDAGQLSGTTVMDRKIKYFNILANGVLLRDEFLNEKRPMHFEEFVFTADYSLPLNQINNQLKDFCDMVMDARRSHTIESSEAPYVLLDYVRDAKGNIDYFAAKGQEPFSLWDRYLRAFDLYKLHGNQWKLIGTELGYYDKSNSNYADKVAANMAKRDVSEAKRLINKSGSSSFPR